MVGRSTGLPWVRRPVGTTDRSSLTRGGEPCLNRSPGERKVRAEVPPRQQPLGIGGSSRGCRRAAPLLPLDLV